MRSPSRNQLLAVVGICSTALAAGLIAFSLAGGSGSRPAPAVAAGASGANALLRDLPQQGLVLGNPQAPVTLVEYADLQCPYCGIWARDTLPALVREYVSQGKVKLVFRGLAFVGPDSATGLAAALAAARQDRLWQVVDLVYANQRQENAGWLDDGLLRSIGSQVPGLDVGRMLGERSSPAVIAAARESQQKADEAGVTSTPSFQVGRSGGPLRRLELRSLDPSAFRPALNALLPS
ncbi:MAG: hypothetical protein C5B48_13015 [Candidatus Rokuibacteriota bacterium]|nr:MAG: hypothetical protein C5B48_13015 [Candidatus Rokubacteria bacterium]